ncbi:hypothetical protein LCGC14_2178340, partial [marine sediment metagenome]
GYMGRFLAQPSNQVLLQDIPNLILTSGGKSEFFSATARGGLLGGRGLVQRGLRAAIAPPQRAFEAFGDLARISMAKGLHATAKRSGRLNELGDLVNHATGVISTAAMGIPVNQQLVEGSMLIFAPRYLRATLALIGDIFGGGLKGEEATKAMASMLTAGTAWYMHIADAVGQEPVLDPADSRFMTIQVGGERAGIGSTWVALMKLVARSITDSETGEFDPTEAVQLTEDNPFLRFWRGRASPVGGAVWDIVESETFLGDPLDSPTRVAAHIGTRFMPFAAQDFLLRGEGQSMRDRGIGALAGGVGLRAFPQRFEDVANSVAQREFGKKFDELTPQEQAIVQRSEEVRSIPKGEGKKGERGREFGRIFGGREETIAVAAQQVDDREITKDQFRGRLNEINTKLSAQLGELETRVPGKPPTDPLEQKRREYQEILGTPDRFGRTPFEAADEWLNQQSAEVVNYIEDKAEASILRVTDERSRELLLDLKEARKVLEPYRDINDQVMQRRGVLDRVQDMTPAEQETFWDSSRGRAIKREIDQRKKRWRRRNPRGDKALVDWYGLVPIRSQR